MTKTPKHLGRASALPPSPDAAELDFVANPQPDTLYLVRFAAPEFTSLCPVTGQPDFAHLVIDYAPRATIIESKKTAVWSTPCALARSSSSRRSRGAAIWPALMLRPQGFEGEPVPISTT